MLLQVEIMPWLSNVVTGSSTPVLLEFEIREKCSLAEFLLKLKQEFPKLASHVISDNNYYLKPTVLLIYNGMAFEIIGGYNKILSDGDKITFIPAYYGG